MHFQFDLFQKPIAVIDVGSGRKFGFELGELIGFRATNFGEFAGKIDEAAGLLFHLVAEQRLAQEVHAVGFEEGEQEFRLVGFVINAGQ